VIPADPPKTGEVGIAPLEEMGLHEVHTRQVSESQVIRGPQADA
jgi:hypothetical protein